MSNFIPLASLRPTSVNPSASQVGNALQTVADTYTPRVGSVPLDLGGGEGGSPTGPVGPASPDNVANAISGAAKGMGALAALGGLPAANVAATGLMSVVGKPAMEKEFERAYGIKGKFDAWDNFKSGISFGKYGNDFGKQNAANTPGINDSGFANGGPGHNTQGGRADRADKDGPQGGSGAGVGSASGEGPGGSAGMGDSEGAASGTWEGGGAVYDGDPSTDGPVQITAHEGEYVMPPYVVEKYGMEFLDNLRRSADPNDEFELGSGEINGMAERIQKTGTSPQDDGLLSRMDGMTEDEFEQMRAASGVILKLLPQLEPLLKQGQENI